MVIRILALPLLAVGLITGSAGAFAETAADAEATPAADASPVPAPGAQHHRKNRMLAALRGLDLSDDQQTKIKGFVTSFRDARTSANPETREQLRAQIEGVLTAPQRTQFDASMRPHTHVTTPSS